MLFYLFLKLSLCVWVCWSITPRCRRLYRCLSRQSCAILIHSEINSFIWWMCQSRYLGSNLSLPLSQLKLKCNWGGNEEKKILNLNVYGGITRGKMFDVTLRQYNSSIFLHSVCFDGGNGLSLSFTLILLKYLHFYQRSMVMAWAQFKW